MPGVTGSASAKRRGRDFRSSQRSIRVGQKGSHLPHLPRSSGGFLGFVLEKPGEGRSILNLIPLNAYSKAYAFSLC